MATTGRGPEVALGIAHRAPCNGQRARLGVKLLDFQLVSVAIGTSLSPLCGVGYDHLSPAPW